jgi:hypothetical protein
MAVTHPRGPDRANRDDKQEHCPSQGHNNVVYLKTENEFRAPTDGEWEVRNQPFLQGPDYRSVPGGSNYIVLEESFPPLYQGYLRDKSHPPGSY